MRGDRVEAIIDTGQGGVQTFEIEATRAGRRVEVTTARGVVEVSEVTRSGQPVRTGRFIAPVFGAGRAAGGLRPRHASRGLHASTPRHERRRLIGRATS
jgi:hypothetical protein